MSLVAVRHVHTTPKSRRVSKRAKPAPKRARFASLQAAYGYADKNNWTTGEVISTPRGDRLQVWKNGRPRTLRIGPPRGRSR